MNIIRNIQPKLLAMAKKMPVIAINGPRQSGKTYTAKQAFPKYPYVTLEDRDIRAFAEADPRRFLDQYKSGVILDEVQRMPDLFSYIQTIVDASGKPGRFILTGSMNFLLLESISQSLAGRVAMLKLLPLSISELVQAGIKIGKPEDAMFRGFYPRIYSAKLAPGDWYPSYTETYIERDVRQIKNISDLGVFRKFLRMCAGRVGQLLNLTELGNQLGITYHTVRSWIGILETSFTVFLLEPHYTNFSKRLVKMPKLYFYDTGLASSLLGIQDAKQLQTHYLRGALFENMVIADIMKARYNDGRQPNLYFWRDRSGNEVDCLIDDGTRQIPIEIKSATTIAADFFKGLNYWNKLSGGDPKNSLLVYGGDTNSIRTNGSVVSWKDAAAKV